MKKFKYAFVTILLLAFFSINIKAQTFKIDTTEISFDNKLRPCYAVFVDPDTKTLKNDWEKYLKKKYSIRTKGNSFFGNNELMKAEDVVINPISKKRLDLYARITETGEGSAMKVFVAFGYDYFAGDEGFQPEFDALKDLLNTFLLKSLNEYYSDEIARINKSVKSLNKEQNSLRKSIAKNNDRMFDAQKDMPTSYNITAKGASAEQSVKDKEKADKLTDKVNKLENENTKAKLKITDVEEKLLEGKSKLELLKEKQRNLSNQ